MLLVEDEQDVRELTAEALRGLGYRVLEADTGAAALRLVQAGVQLDLLLSDVGLPGGMNGRQVAEAVRDRHPGLDVVRKPFDIATLSELVRTRVNPAAPG